MLQFCTLAALEGKFEGKGNCQLKARFCFTRLTSFLSHCRIVVCPICHFSCQHFARLSAAAVAVAVSVVAGHKASFDIASFGTAIGFLLAEISTSLLALLQPACLCDKDMTHPRPLYPLRPVTTSRIVMTTTVNDALLFDFIVFGVYHPPTPPPTRCALQACAYVVRWLFVGNLTVYKI